MPIFEFVCPKCGNKCEELVKNSDCEVFCKICGTKEKRVYSGKIYTATGAKSGGCCGDCKHCKGCGK